MQNRKPPPLSLASTVGSSASNALDRVIAIAPAPLLPGEKEADYAATAAPHCRRRQAEGRNRRISYPRRHRSDLGSPAPSARQGRNPEGLHGREACDDAVWAGVGYAFRDRSTLSESWAAGDESARKKVDAILAKAGLTIDEVTAKTLESKIDVFERIDRMLASAEARRNNALREIDRHRDAAGAAVRRAIDEVEDVEFRDIETGQSSGEPAS